MCMCLRLLSLGVCHIDSGICRSVILFGPNDKVNDVMAHFVIYVMCQLFESYLNIFQNLEICVAVKS